MLQRLCENFQYAELLNKACETNDPHLSLAYIAAFNVGGHSLNPNRTLKFFNPLLMETYEYIDPNQKFRFFAEQVSHHPAISACFAEGEGYTFYTNSNTKQQFLLTKGCLEVINLGKTYVRMKKSGDQIIYSRPKVVIRNLIMGKMFVDFVDTFSVTNQSTGDVCEITFFPFGEPKKGDQGVFKGSVRDYMDNVKVEIEGNWCSHMDVIINGERKRIWEKYNTDTYENYYLTDFSSNLNYLTEELKKVIPPTDSRLRPDQRALEQHEFDFAAKEKHRLEEKQRKKRKENEKNKNYKHNPMYFTETYDDLSGELIYEYNNKYWEDRNNRRFDHFPDLY